MRVPRINVHFNPVTILKIRKLWHGIVPWAVIRVGANLETHCLGMGAWRLRGCLEDTVIEGRLTIRERRRVGGVGGGCQRHEYEDEQDDDDDNDND